MEGVEELVIAKPTGEQEQEELVIAKPTEEQEQGDIFDIDCVNKIICNECVEDFFGTNDFVYVQT